MEICSLEQHFTDTHASIISHAIKGFNIFKKIFLSLELTDTETCRHELQDWVLELQKEGRH